MAFGFPRSRRREVVCWYDLEGPLARMCVAIDTGASRRSAITPRFPPGPASSWGRSGAGGRGGGSPRVVAPDAGSVRSEMAPTTTTARARTLDPAATTRQISSASCSPRAAALEALPDELPPGRRHGEDPALWPAGARVFLPRHRGPAPGRAQPGRPRHGRGRAGPASPGSCARSSKGPGAPSAPGPGPAPEGGGHHGGGQSHVGRHRHSLAGGARPGPGRPARERMSHHR